MFTFGRNHQICHISPVLAHNPDIGQGVAMGAIALPLFRVRKYGISSVYTCT